MAAQAPRVERVTDYLPGAIGRITQLHGTYYAQHWQLGLRFEAAVASGLSEFTLRHDPARDGLWVARANSAIVGSIAIDGSGEGPAHGARLRWLVLEPAHHGQGLGGKLMAAAMTFCREVDHKRVQLWTFEGLDAARALYERHGFRLAEEVPNDARLGRPLTMQLMVWERG